MAEKEPLIVIKKITVQQAGGHGGSWKVAFADFMTAMMAFFLVMWLVSQTEEVKKNVADYFATPSIIEYNFANYGVELTLEKLFLDLMNEPLKFLQTFITPVDYTPNLMAMGSKKVVLHHMADKLGGIAQNIKVTGDEVTFDIPAKELFHRNSGQPGKKFVEIMENVKGMTSGLEDSNVYVDSNIFKQTARGSSQSAAKNIAEQRLDLITKKIEANLEHETVDIYGKSLVNDYGKSFPAGTRPDGIIKFRIKNKPITSEGREPREIDDLFGEGAETMSVYDSFVKQVSERKDERPGRKRRR